jgi:hypothetical protein
VKISKVVAIIIFIIGVVTSNDVMVSTAVIILTLLSCTVEILEAIENKKL